MFRERLVRAYTQLEDSIRSVQNEAEVRARWTSALEAATGLTFEIERDRRDLSYNDVVIEFKDKGLFGGNKGSAAFKNATGERLPKYIQRLAAVDGLPAEDYVGIAIDAVHVSFGQMRDGAFHPGRLLAVSEETFGMVVGACLSGTRRAVTAGNLVTDFGHLSPIGRQFMQALADALARALANKTHPKARKVGMLFKEWRTLYGQVADLGVLQQASIRSSLGFTWQGDAVVWLSASLFVAHTFHSLLVKLFVGELVAAHGLASSTSLVDDVLAEPVVSRLIRLGSDVEEGGFFSAVGLKGFVEEAIFSWYLDAAVADPLARDELNAALSAILAQLHLYRLDVVERAGRSRDILRDFYEDIVPGELRKSLGEFYTPDWLAEYTVDQLGFRDGDWLTKRTLDPTCGSGTFLLEAIRRKRAAAVAAEWGASDTLDMLMSSVWGFDLNPLAVQTARANVLMAVADLLKACGGKEVEIPVLLADAIYSPAAPPDDLLKVVTYTIGSDVANLQVVLPADLAFDRARLDRVFEVMGEQVEQGVPYAVVEAGLLASGILTHKRAADWRMQLKQTYERVLDLHNRDWNGIWFRIVRNFFWSATAGTFDAVVGNPPWVRWSNLPAAYRDRAKPTCERYDIFSDTPYFGGNELDISAIITFTTADKWLSDGGRLAFVITQTVFQTPSSQGFRRFRLDRYHTLVPLAVDDMKALRPFPDAANRTAVALFEKRRHARSWFPVPYREWVGMIPGGQVQARRRRHALPDVSGVGRLHRVVPPMSSKADVLRRMIIRDLAANPASPDQPGAPWAVMDVASFEAHGELLGRSDWVQGRKGITTDLNGVFFVTIIDTNEALGRVRVRTRPEEGKRDIGGPREFWVEAETLYPLLKGAGDFDANYIRPAEKLFALTTYRFEAGPLTA